MQEKSSCVFFLSFPPSFSPNKSIDFSLPHFTRISAALDLFSVKPLSQNDEGFLYHHLVVFFITLFERKGEGTKSVGEKKCY